MRSTIDEAGRVVITKALRDRLGLKGGELFDIRERDGTLEIEPAATPMRLVAREATTAAVLEQEPPPLTDDIVRETLGRTRGDRGRYEPRRRALRDVARVPMRRLGGRCPAAS